MLRFSFQLSTIYETKPPISKAKVASVTRLAVKAIKVGFDLISKFRAEKMMLLVQTYVCNLLIAVLQARGPKHREICAEGQFKLLFSFMVL